MKFIYTKKFIYTIFFLSFLGLYLIIQSFSLKNKLRQLKEEDYLEKFCKINKDLYEYYYKDAEYQYDFYGIKYEKIEGGSKEILDIILNYDNFNSSNIFKYFKYTGVYIFFFILLILIILASIYYSFAACVKMCCWDKCFNFFNLSCCKNQRLKKAICIIIPFIYILVLFFALTSTIMVSLAVDKFAGAVCVGFQLVDSVLEGETSRKVPYWAGISIVDEVIKSLGDITSKSIETYANNIFTHQLEYQKKYNEWYQTLDESYKRIFENIENGTYKGIDILDPKMTGENQEHNKRITPYHIFNWGPYDNENSILGEIELTDNENTDIELILSVIENYIFPLFGCDYDQTENKIKCQENNPLSLLFNQGAEKISSLREPITIIKNEFVEPAKSTYDTVDDYLIQIFIVVGVFVIFYSLVILILLGIFCCTKNVKCLGTFFKWILCFIYYTSILIVILGFIVGIIFGFIGKAAQDAAIVLDYIVSSKNLNSESPIILGKGLHNEYLDVCLNGDGDLLKKFALSSNFEKIENIIEISDDAEELIDNTTNTSSPYIEEEIEYFTHLNETYLNIPYLDTESKDNFNISERIDEINNYVSGRYSQKGDSCSIINENWSKKNEGVDGYIYDSNYPLPDESSNKNLLIYLYEENLYTKAKLETRYNNACPTDGHPYTTVSEASQKFGKLFSDIQSNVLSDEFNKNFKDDLVKLNKIYGEKNMYINALGKALINVINPIVNSFINHHIEKGGILSMLNCKFIGENKSLLLYSLNNSLGVYLDAFGIITCLMSLSMFIGVVFILIIVRNTKIQENISTMDIKTLDDILKGDDEIKDKSQGELLTELTSKV